jgi:autotransporter-associated beta strand protein
MTSNRARFRPSRRAALLLSACAVGWPGAALATDTTISSPTTSTVEIGGDDTVTIQAGGSITVTGARGINYRNAPTGDGPTIDNYGTIDATASSSGRALDTQTSTAERSITINNFSTGIFRSTQDAIRILNSGDDVTAATIITINNQGTIESTNGQGIDLASIPSATVSITNSGTISGAGGIEAGAATIDSSGTITATEDEAIRLNADADSIITLRAGSVTTAGSETGNAIFLSGGDNIVNLETGATVNGNIRAGSASSGGIDTLNLFGSGAAVLPSVQNFDRIDVQSGDWTLVAAAFATAQGAIIEDGATLRYGDGGAAGNISGTVENNGLLVFNRSDTYAQLATAAFSGSGDFQIAGTGTLALTVANSWTGATRIDAGSLRGDAAGVFAPDSAVTAGAAGTLDLNGFDQTIASLAGAGTVSTNATDGLSGGTLTLGGDGADSVFSGTITGLGGLVKQGAGTLTLSGVSDFTGATSLAGGGLLIDGSLAGPVSAATGTTLGGTGMIAGGVAIADGATLAPGDGGVGTLVTGTLGLGAGSTLAFDLGTPGDDAASDHITVAGDLTLDGTLDASDAGGFSFGVYHLIDYSGALTDNGLEIGAVPAGTRTDLLSIQTVFTGQVNLVYGDAGTGVPAVQFWDGGDSAPDGVVDGGAGSWTNADVHWTRANGTANDAWGSQFAVFQGAAGTVRVDDAIAFTGMQFLTDGYAIAGGSGTLTIAGMSATIRVDPGVVATIDAGIGGTGGLDKRDGGTLVLAGANSYAGTTGINGGTLVLDGDLAGGVLVGSGATLAGTGAAAGTVAIGAGGTLAPGDDGVGTLTVGGLVLDPAAILAYDLGAPDTAGASDRIQIDGDLTLDGTLNAADAGGFGIGVYRLIDYSGALTDNGLAVGAIPAGFDSSQLSVQTTTGGQVNLIVDAVIPEIQFWDGGNTISNGAIDGGSGSWTNTTRDWADMDGANNNRWNGRFAVFAGTAGKVRVDDAIAVTGMQFMTDGYEIAQGSGTLSLAEAATSVRVDPGVIAGISADIGGDGGLVKRDGGTLVLSGANDYGGATVIEGGVLRVGGGAALPAAGAVTIGADGTLDIAESQAIGGLAGAGAVTLSGGSLTTGGNGASTAFTGIVSGSGGLTKTGDGTLTLGGANGYTGATEVAGGTLALGADASIAASSGVSLGASDAVLDIAAGDQAIASLAGVAGSRVRLGASTLDVGDDVSTSFAGAIDGSGGLVKTGAGTLTLTGANSYTGATRVDAGLLVVDGTLASTVSVAAGARLQGTGRIGALAVGGTLAPGNSIGTLAVAGDLRFLAGSTFDVETRADGGADLVTATGAVTIDGGTVAVHALDTAYGVATEYRIVSGASVAGAFDSVTSDLAFLTPTLGYDSTSVNLVLTRNDVALADVAETANQAAVANALSARGGGTLYGTVIGFDAPTARGAFDRLSGEIHADLPRFAARDARLLGEAMLDRAADARARGAGIQFIAARGSAGGDHGFADADSNTIGAIGGIDADLGNVRLGVAGGYTRSNIVLDSLASTAKLRTLHLGAYGAGTFGPLRLRFGAGWSSHDADSRRAPIFGTFGDDLSASEDGTTLQAFGEAGWRVGADDDWIEPFAGLSVQRVRFDGANEQGGPAALAVGRASDTAFEGLAGAHAAAAFELDGGLRMGLVGTLAVRHYFSDAPGLRAMAFEDGGPAFFVEGADFGRTSAQVRVGAWVGVLGGRIGVAYSGELSSGYSNNGARVTASWAF